MIPQSNEIRIEPATICNYRCAMCKVQDMSRKQSTMSLDYFKFLIDKIRQETDQYKTITLAGIGEPLLNAHLEPMTEYATGLGFRVLLVTNGSMLSWLRFRDLQSAGLYSVRVSFHGATPEGYCALHGVDKSQYYRTLGNVMAASDQRTTCRLLLTWAQVEGVNNDESETWIKKWEGHVDLMEIWRAHNWAGAFNFRKEQDIKMRTCGRLDRGPLQIQVDGRLTTCCFDYDGVLAFGDLNTQTLSEIFESEKFRAMKDCHDSGDYKNSGLICEHCDQRNADKSDVLIYSSEKVDFADRVRRTSTGYTDTHVVQPEVKS